MIEIYQSHANLPPHNVSFQVSEMLFLPVREKLLTESQPDIVRMARSRRQIDESYSDANACTGINRFSLPVPVLNQTESNKARLVSGESMITLFK